MRRLLLSTVFISALALPAFAQNPPPYVTDTNGALKPVTPTYQIGGAAAGGTSSSPATTGGATTAGTLAQGQVVSTDPAYAAGGIQNLNLSTNGHLRTDAFVVGTVPVSNAGTFAVQNTAATPAGTNLIGKVGIDQTTPGTTNLVWAMGNQGFEDTTTPLAANGTFSGTFRTPPVWANTFGVQVNANQIGTLNIAQNGITVATVAVVANTTVDLEVPIRGTQPYAIFFQNGATLETTLQIRSSFRTGNK